MKRVLFISPSKLAQQLMGLIVAGIPKKTEFRALSGLAEASGVFFTKPVQLIILDAALFQNGLLQELRQKPFAQSSLKILLADKAHIPSLAERHEWGIATCLVKPFLAEELTSLLNDKLGNKS